MATSKQMALFWNIVLYSLVEKHVSVMLTTSIILMMEAVTTSETPVNVYHTPSAALKTDRETDTGDIESRQIENGQVDSRYI
jgi:hypothetical protein